jgi:hypothetical protein
MYKLLFGLAHQNDAPIDIPLCDAFRYEGDWLKNKRQELINKDKNESQKYLINNPKFYVTKLETKL